METDMRDVRDDLAQLRKDVALIKDVLLLSGKDPEGELSEWAIQELAEAREIPDSENISLEDLKKEIENDVSD